MNLWDALFGKRVELRVETPSGTRVVRVTRRWLASMEAKGVFGPESVGVVAHVIEVDNSVVEETWAVGTDISKDDHERWLDPGTEAVYAMRYLSDGHLVQRLLAKRAWNWAVAQLEDRASGRSEDSPQPSLEPGAIGRLLEVSYQFPEALPMHIVCEVPSGTVGRPYEHQVIARGGGKRPRTWSLEPGSTLPPGLHLSSDGKLVGTPEEEGETYFRVVVADDGGYKVPGEIALNVDRDWLAE